MCVCVCVCVCVRVCAYSSLQENPCELPRQYQEALDRRKQSVHIIHSTHSSILIPRVRGGLEGSKCIILC